MTRELFNLFGPLDYLDPGALRLISPTLSVELPHALSLACAVYLAEGSGRDVVFWQEHCPDRGEFRWCIGTVLRAVEFARPPSGYVQGDVTAVYSTRRRDFTAYAYLLTNARYEKASSVSASTFA
jgi:hypothetical protein